MGKCLSVCSNLLFAELLIQHAIKNVGNLLGVPQLTVLVSVVHFFGSGLVEEECNKAQDNW